MTPGMHTPGVLGGNKYDVPMITETAHAIGYAKLGDVKKLPAKSATVSVWRDYAKTYRVYGSTTGVNGAQMFQWKTKTMPTTKDPLVADLESWYEDVTRRKKECPQQDFAAMFVDKIILDLKQSTTVVCEVLEHSGCLELSDFIELDEKGVDAVVSGAGWKPGLASKVRKWHTSLQVPTGLPAVVPTTDGNDGSSKARTGRLVQVESLSPNPGAVDYRLWKETVDDWYEVSKDRHNNQDMYLMLTNAIPTRDRLNYMREVDQPKRGVKHLMDYVHNVYKADMDLREYHDYNDYATFKRKGKSFRDFRLEWERKRAVALRTGRLTAGKQDYDDFVRMLELSREQLVSLNQEVSTKEKAAEGAGALTFDKLDCALEWLKHVIYAEEHAAGNGSDPRNPGKKTKVDWNNPVALAAWTAATSKGKGSGKGSGKGGKGKGSAHRSSSAPRTGTGTTDGKAAMRKPCPKGANCPNKTSCELWHPGEGRVKNTKGGGKGGKYKAKTHNGKVTKKKPGGADRKCPKPDCGFMVFGSKTKCLKCGTDVPPASA